jgi:hypothetical protein
LENFSANGVTCLDMSTSPITSTTTKRNKLWIWAKPKIYTLVEKVPKTWQLLGN